MRRYLKLGLMAILVVSFIFGGCSNSSQEQRIAELEQQIEELQQENEELTQQISELTAPPELIKSIDKTVILMMNPALWIPPVEGPFIYDGYFTIPLEKGNRIEGEISTTLPEFTDCRILDPYGNIVVRSAYSSQTKRFVQRYPWKFSLVAIISGDYEFKIDTSTLMMGESKEIAEISISVYDK